MATKIPQYPAFFNPVLKALRSLGGSASIQELNEKVIELLGLPNEVLEVIHDPETGNETEVEYRLAWARTYLKKYGLINNSSRGVWSLTDKADGVQEVEAEQVVRFVQKRDKEREPAQKNKTTKIGEENGLGVEESLAWKAQLHQLLQSPLTRWRSNG